MAVPGGTVLVDFVSPVAVTHNIDSAMHEHMLLAFVPV